MSHSVGRPEVSSLDEEEIHDVLRNRRRRLVIDLLQGHGGDISVRELSERIGAIESDTESPPRKVKQSVYASLVQWHLPKLDGLGIVDYRPEGKTVRVAGAFDDVELFLETVPKYGISRSEFYAGLALLGLLVVFGAEVGTPLLSDVSGVNWAYGFLVVILGAGIYHTYTQGRSIVHRLLA